ncbi:MAG: protein phosphatase 2C domain-containing protein [Bacteroides sp.]|nr:protein phosphatase 2C domain-containing protein [Bacteroides sp.]
MNRLQKRYGLKQPKVHAPNGTALKIDRILSEIGVPPGERDSFLSWALSDLWNSFKTERMNKRIVIENEIRQLGIHLPNGTQNKEYAASFNLPMDKISDISLDGADELPLIFECSPEGVCSLSGTPDKSGDFNLILRYRTVEGEPESQLRIPIAFNADPRTLWTSKPTPRSIPYFKEDSDCAYIKVEAADDMLPRKDIVAASQRGRSHAQEGKPRDDHFSVLHCEDSDWYVLAVADGAGSAIYSRRGSQIACETVTQYCRSRLTGNPDFENDICEWQKDTSDREKRTVVTRQVIDILVNAAKLAHQKIKDEAIKENARLKDYATTLMFTICKRFSFGWFMASFWVGDGALCLYDEKNKTAKLLGTPDEGEYSGQTRFLTMPEIFHDKDFAQKRLRMAVVPDFTALFLMTDGISDPMFETDRNLNDFSKWEAFYRRLKEGFPEDKIGGVDLSDDNEAAKDQLLGWLDFWSPGNHDDRTLAMLY